MCEKIFFYPGTKRRTQLVKVHPSIFVPFQKEGCRPNFPLAFLLSLLQMYLLTLC